MKQKLEWPRKEKKTHDHRLKVAWHPWHEPPKHHVRGHVSPGKACNAFNCSVPWTAPAILPWFSLCILLSSLVSISDALGSRAANRIFPLRAIKREISTWSTPCSGARNKRVPPFTHHPPCLSCSPFDPCLPRLAHSSSPRSSPPAFALPPTSWLYLSEQRQHTHPDVRGASERKCREENAKGGGRGGERHGVQWWWQASKEKGMGGGGGTLLFLHPGYVPCLLYHSYSLFLLPSLLSSRSSCSLPPFLPPHGFISCLPHSSPPPLARMLLFTRARRLASPFLPASGQLSPLASMGILFPALPHWVGPTAFLRLAGQ